MANLTQGTSVVPGGQSAEPNQRSPYTSLPEMFSYCNANNLLQTFDAVQIRRALLYAALTHFFVGLITILLTILLGSTVTEAILAVWALFCGVVGFGAICVHRAQTNYNETESVSFAKIWLQVYLGMTLLGAVLAAATVIHGAVLLGMSVPLQNQARQKSATDMQEFITSSFSVWFVILGASNIFIGFAAGAADLLLIKKTLITLRSHKTIVTGPAGARAIENPPPRYLDIPPPRYSTRGEIPHSNWDAKSELPSESPPSYEASVVLPAPATVSSMPESSAPISTVA